VEKVQALKAEHEELRQGWQELRSWLEREGSHQMDGVALRASFQRYSDCFAGHLALEESLQFSSETKSLFQRWDS
jgi:hemerythrin-like domain-containing protein